MALKKCPNCGIPIPGYDVCPVCGTVVESQTQQREKSNISNIVHDNKDRDIKLSAWEIALILICNVSLILIVVNSVVGGDGWFFYPVVVMFLVYSISFTANAGNVPRFLTRYRNTVFIFNLVLVLCSLLCSSLNGRAILWPFNYFVPCNLIVANIVCTILLTKKNIGTKSVLFASLIFFMQSLVQMLLLAFGVIGVDNLVKILIYVSFGVNLITIINLVILYVLKFKNDISETFKFWE